MRRSSPPGPGIRKQDPVAGIRAIDVAPTLAFLMGIPGPQNAAGRILTNLRPEPGQLQAGHDPRHLRLPRSARAADRDGRQRHGSGLGEPGLHDRRLGVPEAVVRPLPRRPTATRLPSRPATRSGATPPISAFFGDKPTIELMNLMGFSADGLGNHNFDKGPAYLRNTLIPAGEVPVPLGERRRRDGKTPKEWSPSKMFNFDGFKLGLIGFTNEDAPTLVFPGSFDPFHARERDGRCERRGREAQGGEHRHDRRHRPPRRDGGHAHEPDRPVVDLADNVTNVDAVIGDHTDFQVLDDEAERRAPRREPEQGPPLHAGAADRRHELQVGHLQDGELPQAVDDRRHARSGDPGADRRAERATQADPRHGDRKRDQVRSRAPTSAGGPTAGSASRSSAT